MSGRHGHHPATEDLPVNRPEYKPPNRRNGFATWTLILGLVALTLSPVPILNQGGILVGIVGVGLGITAIIISHRRNEWKIFSWIGTLLCVFAIVISFVVTDYYVAEMNRSFDEAGLSATPPVEPFTYTPVPSPADPPDYDVTTFTSGVWPVGTEPGQIEPGRYTTTGPNSSDLLPMCYWARLSEADGEMSSIKANDTVEGRSTMTVRESDRYIEFSGSCEWATIKESE